MKSRWLFVYLITLTYGLAQADGPQPQPEARIVRMTLDTQSVSVLHLRPGYVSCVRLPEDISTVVLGNPSTFKAEHSDAEPRLVSLKPTTLSRAETNALITTKTGREVALQLISGGSTDHAGPVDFVLEYDHPHGFLIEPSRPSFIISQTENLTPELLPTAAKSKSPLANDPGLLRQQHERTPHWQGKQLRVAVGSVSETDQQMAVAFSVLNATASTIELLPPQIELAGTSKKGHRRAVKAEPVPIHDYAITNRRLSPGARADAVVVFERPSFKESTEQMLLQIAQAEEVDRAVVVPIAFVGPVEGEEK